MAEVKQASGAAGMAGAEATGKTGNEAWSIEQHGINLIPQGERRGSPRELFWVWAAGDIVITYCFIGSILASLGLTLGQLFLIIVLGNLPFFLIGYGGIPGARVGTATLVISRAAFGRTGNMAPSLLSWITVVGWEAVNLVLGTLALISLVSAFGWTPDVLGKAVLLGIIAVFTFGVAILGHATIFYLQRIFTWGLGIVVLGLAPQVIAAYTGAPALAAASGASLANLCLAFTVIAAMPLSWANYPADYTRYLPRNASGPGIVWWTYLGGVLPAALMAIVGYLAARVVDLSDPIGGFKPLLPAWYFDIFVLVVVGGTITNNFMNTYSSGLSLLAVGLKLKRSTAILLDAVLATAASVYAIFFYDFTTAFINFLSLMIAWIAPWFAVYLVDTYLRGGNYNGPDLISADGGSYRYGNGWHKPGFIAWIAGMFASLAFTNAAIFQSPLVMGPLGGADLSIAMGLAVAGVLYWVLAKDSIAKT